MLRLLLPLPILSATSGDSCKDDIMEAPMICKPRTSFILNCEANEAGQGLSALLNENALEIHRMTEDRFHLLAKDKQDLTTGYQELDTSASCFASRPSPKFILPSSATSREQT